MASRPVLSLETLLRTLLAALCGCGVGQISNTAAQAPRFEPGSDGSSIWRMET
jgi:hypothetical protein